MPSEDSASASALAGKGEELAAAAARSLAGYGRPYVTRKAAGKVKERLTHEYAQTMGKTIFGNSDSEDDPYDNPADGCEELGIQPEWDEEGRKRYGQYHVRGYENTYMKGHGVWYGCAVWFVSEPDADDADAPRVAVGPMQVALPSDDDKFYSPETIEASKPYPCKARTRIRDRPGDVVLLRLMRESSHPMPTGLLCIERRDKGFVKGHGSTFSEGWWQAEPKGALSDGAPFLLKSLKSLWYLDGRHRDEHGKPVLMATTEERDAPRWRVHFRRPANATVPEIPVDADKIRVLAPPTPPGANPWDEGVAGIDRVQLYRESALFRDNKLTPTQLDEFVRNGFIVLKGVIPKELIHDAYQMLHAPHVDKFGTVYERPFPDWLASRVVRERVKSPSAYRLVYGTPLAAYIMGLVGNMREDPFEARGYQHAETEPEHAFKTRNPDACADWDWFLNRIQSFHVDGIGQGRLTDFSLLCGIALTDQRGPASGCLIVWPGTHHIMGEHIKAHFAEHDAYKRASLVYDEKALERMDMEFLDMIKEGPMKGRKPVPVLLEEGDVVLAHHKLAHCVGPNLSNIVRNQMYVRISMNQGGNKLAVDEELDDMWYAFHSPELKAALQRWEDAGRPGPDAHYVVKKPF